MESTGEGQKDAQEKIVLSNQNPVFVQNMMSLAISFIQTYGWFLLLGGLLCAFIYDRYASKFSRWRQKRQEYYEEQENKKNPDKAYQIQLSVEQSRMKLQERVQMDALKRKEAMEKREEEKRQQRIDEWDQHQQGKGYHSKYKPQDTTAEDIINGHVKPRKKDRLRQSDYNPLSGNSGGSCGFRPSTRRGGGGMGGG